MILVRLFAISVTNSTLAKMRDKDFFSKLKSKSKWMKTQMTEASDLKYYK